ncbi:alanine/glycine:cation symporter family protein [Moritella viscosa]
MISKVSCYFAVILSMFTSSAFAASESVGFDKAVDQFFNENLSWFANTIFTSVPVNGTNFPIIVGWLFIAAIIFTFYFGFVQFKRFGLAVGFANLGKVLAVGFAIMTILGALGGGNMFQGNQANAMIVQTLGLPDGYGWVTGVILATMVGSVIIGGMPSIARVTGKLVPTMALLYVGMSVIVLVSNASMIGDAFAQIIEGAFTGAGVAGGFVGALIQGNEAGVGSAAIAHAAVKTKEPVTEGLVSVLEPFIDTVIICTMTALVITISGMNNGELSGVTLTAAAFTETADIFQYILAVAVVMFAFSTMISWSYYGLKAWTYLFGEGKTTELVYKVMFCGFVVIGASVSFGAVIDFSDAAIFAMSIFNIIGLYFLMPVVKKELQSFIARVKSGEIKDYSKEGVLVSKELNN